jgi:hypothetical protein
LSRWFELPGIVLAAALIAVAAGPLGSVTAKAA